VRGGAGAGVGSARDRALPRHGPPAAAGPAARSGSRARSRRRARPHTMMAGAWRPRGWTVAALLLAAFALRLAFGLCSELFGPDESQIFLIGLKYFTTGEWPYFGPDVVYTHTQLPGALQGLLVGGPLFLVAEPEAA